MKVGISFTDLLRACITGKSAPEYPGEKPENFFIENIDMIFVGCSKEHLPEPTSMLLPVECSWMRFPGQEPIKQDYTSHLIERGKLYIQQIEGYIRLYNRMNNVPVFRIHENYWRVAYNLLKGSCKLPMVEPNSIKYPCGVDISEPVTEVYLKYRWWNLEDITRELTENSGDPSCLAPMYEDDVSQIIF